MITETVEYRARVAQRYCRSVIAIDDGIFEDAARGLLAPHYLSLQKNCESLGMLCHLHNYERTTLEVTDPEAAPKIKLATELAVRSDLVILDWNLGADNPSHAVALLKNLSSAGSVQFVVVYTNGTLTDVTEALKKSLPGLTQIAQPTTQPPPPQSTELTGEEDDSPKLAAPVATGTQDPIEFQKDSKFFITLRHKGGDGKIDTSELLVQAHGLLQKSFPDHLHWAGLELAVRVREELPQVIASIPPNTDGALMVQMLHQRPDEVSDQVVEVLLDELRFKFQGNPLGAVSDKMLFDELKDLMCSFCKPEDAYWDSTATLSTAWGAAIKRVRSQPATSLAADAAQTKAKLDEHKSNWEGATKESVRLVGPRVDPRYFPFKRGKDDPSAFTVANTIDAALKRRASATDFRAWASIRESVMSAPGTELAPGFVLKRSEGTSSAEPEWLLCITSACDCYRIKDGGYLFVTGEGHSESWPSASGSAAKTQTCLGKTHIIWDASRLKVADPLDATPRTHEIAGVIRTSFASRIIQRVWAYQSRVGVDSSEVFRALRGEG